MKISPELEMALRTLEPRRRRVVASAIRDTPSLVPLSDLEEKVYQELGKLVLNSGPVS